MNSMKTFLMSLIRFYQRFISVLSSPKCRHLPTCSEYAYEAFYKHGLLKGAYLTVARLLKCHPWSEPKVDFVPEIKNPPLLNSLNKKNTFFLPRFLRFKKNMKVDINAD